MDLFKLGCSWGGVRKPHGAHLSIHPAVEHAMDAPGPSVRIHVGLEDVDDLLADLDRGFARMRTLALKRSPGANP